MYYSVYGSGPNAHWISDVLLDDAGNPLGPVVVGISDEQGAFRYTPSQGVEWIDMNLRSLKGMNSEGTFCGEGWFEVPRNKNTSYEVLAPYLVRADGSYTIFPETAPYADDINANEDLTLYERGNIKLLHADLGLLNLDDLVTGTAGDLEIWNSANLSFSYLGSRNPVTDPDQINPSQFPTICSSFALKDSEGNYIGGLGVVLTPVPAP